jgi:phosphotransferase system  glucose/maltose/N-acetylglucosamine-specific IIC component
VEPQPSTAAQILIAIIPIVGIVMGSTVVFFYLLWNHKRKTLLIQTGHYSRPHFDLLSFSLLTGLLLTSVGTALTLFLAIALGVNFGLLGGIIPLAIGIGLLVYYGIKRGGRGS